MKVRERGHVYELDQLDTMPGTAPQLLVFVNREAGTEHPGTQTQDVLRVQIDVLDCLADRTNHCDECEAWPGNAEIVKHLTDAQRHLRHAILLHEHRAHQRKIDRGKFHPEREPVGPDGHFIVHSE